MWQGLVLDALRYSGGRQGSDPFYQAAGEGIRGYYQPEILRHVFGRP